MATKPTLLITQKAETPALREQILPPLALALALAASAYWYLGGGAVWYRGSGADWSSPSAIIPLALVALIWPLRWIVVGLGLRSTRFTWPLVLFLVSAGIGLWAAYDRGPALAKFWLVVGGISLCAALAHQRRWWQIYGGMATLGGLGAGLALYFVASNDWATAPVKMAVMNQLGGQVARLLPNITGHRISPNVAGGLLASLAPNYLALGVLSWRGWRGLGKRPLLAKALAVLWALAGVWVLLVLLITSSRGAWLAVLVAAGSWGWWRMLCSWAAQQTHDRDKAWARRVRAMALTVGLGALLLLIGAVLVLQLDLPGAGALGGRLGLYRDALWLARDYWLTGAGLGTFEMQFSVYTLLIHVGYIVNAHDVLLDLLIEQGALGLVGYLWLLGAALVWGIRRQRRASENVRWLLEATLISLLVAAGHGLFDDVHYGSRALLFMFAPVGLLLAAGRQASEQEGETHSPQVSRWGAWLVAAAALLLVLGAGWRLALAQVWATMGAVAQARIELNVYDQKAFHQLSVDDMRRQEDLSEPMAMLQRALSYYPGHAMANQRLAAIALARGEYDQAHQMMGAAWNAGHRDPVTRMLFGDALVADGQVEQAAAILKGLPWAVPRLGGQAWERFYRHDDRERAVWAWQTVLLLEPGNKHAVTWLAEIAR